MALINDSSVRFIGQYERIQSKRERFFSRVGSPVVDEFSAVYDRSGVLQLEKTGEHSLYDEIQSHKDSTDIQMILNRYFNGDPAVLSRVQGAYMDIVGMPTNVHEAMALVDNARADFAKLPPSVKELFGNDPNQFLASIGSPEWLEKMQVPVDDLHAADSVVKEVVENGES